MNPDNAKDWDSLREYVELNGDSDSLAMVELLQVVGAKLPTSAMIDNDGDLSLEWREGKSIIGWEFGDLTLMLNCRCVGFHTFLEARNDQP